MLYVHLEDGREIGASLAWFLRLAKATEKERQRWEIICDGEGIHWAGIDEDISVASLTGVQD